MKSPKRGLAFIQPMRGTCRTCGRVAQFCVFQRGKHLGDYCRECGDKKVKSLNSRAALSTSAPVPEAVAPCETSPHLR